MRKWTWLLACLLPALAPAQNKQLDIYGEIAIDKEGAVYAVDFETIVVPEVKQLVDASIRKWRFEPVIRDGKPVYAKSNVSLTLLAVAVDNGYRLQIERARFYTDREAVVRKAPEYPSEAVRAGFGADLLVALRVDKDGNVQEATVLQTRLLGRNGADTKGPSGLRTKFERTTIETYKEWKYKPADPEAGESADATILTRMSYRTGDQPRDKGGWIPQMQEPFKPVPWLAQDKQQLDAEGLKVGQSIAMGEGVKLRTPVEGKAL